MKEIESIIIFPQYLRAKPMKIVIMKMVTAMPVSANAPLIMSMPKIVQFLDVSSFHKVLLVGSECMLYRSTSRVPWYFLSNWQEFCQIDQCASDFNDFIPFWRQIWSSNVISFFQNEKIRQMETSRPMERFFPSRVIKSFPCKYKIWRAIFWRVFLMVNWHWYFKIPIWFRYESVSSGIENTVRFI